MDWVPWGPEALSLAKEEDRPLFVSIGYFACHWCHVMARESFEDPATASLLNRYFVPVKVDREERPDIDELYMDATIALNGSGGWPMSVFCFPTGEPFFAGTYFPPRSRHGLVGFPQLLKAIANAWQSQRQELEEQAQEISRAVEEMRRSRLAPRSSRPTALPWNAPKHQPKYQSPSGRPSQGTSTLGMDAILRGKRTESLDFEAKALAAALQAFDERNGGFGLAPKFPQAPLLELLARSALWKVKPAFDHPQGLGDGLETPFLDPMDALGKTLDAMARGGIYDQLEGGFARYSVDASWQVPHFEKMLYDQASLARIYLHAHLLQKNPHWQRVIEETIDWTLRILGNPDGSLASSLGADSEGYEGLYYLWTTREIRSALEAEQAEAFISFYGLTDSGNFEALPGANVLHCNELARPAELEEARRRLLGVRRQRIPPERDDKVVTEWNAMAIATLAEAASTLGRPDWGDAGVACAEFLIENLRDSDGRWLRSFCNGQKGHRATGRDLAWLVEAFTRLAELTGQEDWLEQASSCARQLVSFYADVQSLVVLSASDQEGIASRTPDVVDSATPSASSVAAVALLRLGALTDQDWMIERARSMVEATSLALERNPLAFAHMAWARSVLERGLTQVVIPCEVATRYGLTEQAEGPERAHKGLEPESRPIRNPSDPSHSPASPTGSPAVSVSGLASKLEPGATRSCQRLLEIARSRFSPDAVLLWGKPGRGPMWEGRVTGYAYVCHGNACLPPTGVEQLASILDGG